MLFRRLGCFTGGGIFAAVITILLVGGFTFYRGGGLFSPGELNAQASGGILGGVASHAELSEDCEACHTSFWSGETMQDRCLACHTYLFEHEKTFHSIMLAESKETPCQDCHTEHHGPNASLTVEEIRGFPHNLMGFSLALHQEHRDGISFACSDCHQGTFTSMDQKECMDCHLKDDFDVMKQHAFDFGDNCLACHDGHDQFSAPFDHERLAFKIEGLHSEVRCADCHVETTSLGHFAQAQQDCMGCHADNNPHEPDIGYTCARCHTPFGWDTVSFDHNQSDFSLLGAHAEVSCSDCHASEAGGAMVFRGTPEDCFSCHAEVDAHEGELGTDCAACHTPESWEQTTFEHTQSVFALTGEHVNVACEDCHFDSAAGRMVFRGIPQDCFSCHQDDDAHDGELGSECASCHVTDGWEQVNFDHNSSSFPLTGSHSVACRDCHFDSSKNRMVYRNIPKNCYACHAGDDEHNGQFGTDCAACHSTSSWGDTNFNHMFPINHGESNNSCQTCHPNSYSSYTCYQCHDRAEVEEEHQEEEIGDFQDCMRCHPDGREND